MDIKNEISIRKYLKAYNKSMLFNTRRMIDKFVALCRRTYRNLNRKQKIRSSEQLIFLLKLERMVKIVSRSLKSMTNRM